jgi:hypothetical protein
LFLLRRALLQSIDGCNTVHDQIRQVRDGLATNYWRWFAICSLLQGTLNGLQTNKWFAKIHVCAVHHFNRLHGRNEFMIKGVRQVQYGVGTIYGCWVANCYLCLLVFVAACITSIDCTGAILFMIKYAKFEMALLQITGVDLQFVLSFRVHLVGCKQLNGLQ